MPEISFILVNYNTAEFTRRCIASILETPGPYEIIVVDNSEDPALLAGIGTADGKVRLVRSGSNLGFTGGNNYGARFAKGDLLVILNNDTVVRPGMVSGIAAATACHNQNDIVTGYIEKPAGGAQVSCGRFPSVLYELLKFCVFTIKYLPLPYTERFRIRTWEHETIQKVDWCTGAFFIIDRSTYNRLGGFDENIFMYMDDVELHTRVHALGGNVYYHPELRILHFGARSSAKINFGGIQHQYRSTVYYFKKHSGAPAGVFFAGIVKGAAIWWYVFFSFLALLSAGSIMKIRLKARLFKAILTA